MINLTRLFYPGLLHWLMMGCASIVAAGLFGFTEPGEAARQSIRYRILPESSLEVHGKTNVNTFCCSSQEQFGARTARLTQHGKTIQFERTALVLRTALLDCANRGINKDLQKLLQTDKHPALTIALLSARPASGPTSRLPPGTWQTLSVQTQITITQVTRAVTMLVYVQPLADQCYRIMGSTTVCLTDFGLEPPTAVMGLVKVKDEIDIDFDLTVATTR